MVRAVGARERVEKPKISVKPSCAAASEPGCVRLGALGPTPTIRSSRRGSDGVDAHSDGSAQPARLQAAQVARKTGRTDRGGRAAAEVDVLIEILWSSN